MKRPDYEALDGQGLPVVRPALTIGELPTPEERQRALASASIYITNLLGLVAKRPIGFGVPVHLAFGMTRQQAKKHAKAQLLLTSGADLALDLCPEYC